MSSNTKWLPLYVTDYLGDTMHLTTLQHGAYMLLLMHYWRSGPLPSDPAQLAAIARMDERAWKPVWTVLQPFFTANGDGTLHQKRMDWELRRWGEIADKRREAGRRGAEAKHRTHPRVAAEDNKPSPLAGKQAGKTLAIATDLPVDNLANATDLPPPLPDVCQPNSGKCQDFATHFASVHLHPQRKNPSSIGEDMRAGARSEPTPSNNLVDLPTDNLRDWLEDNLRQAEAEEAKRYERKSSHNLDVQKEAVAKVARPAAKPLATSHLAMMRKQAGMVAA
jgi:uncharacterized protein YdaU (DUF1376 family)